MINYCKIFIIDKNYFFEILLFYVIKTKFMLQKKEVKKIVVIMLILILYNNLFLYYIWSDYNKQKQGLYLLFSYLIGKTKNILYSFLNLEIYLTNHIFKNKYDWSELVMNGVYYTPFTTNSD